MFGDNSDGFNNEIEIINYINSCKFFNNLNRNFKNFLTFLYNSNLEGVEISAYKPKGQVKPDIAITINGITKYISVKKGSSNSVHQEPLVVFEAFLLNAGISAQTINCLKEFHYGDGSIDGNGGTRVSAAQWQAQNPQKILQVNRELNVSGILIHLFLKFLFVGNLPGAPIVDALYHGNINEGLWASRDEIIRYLLLMNNNSLNIHFSNLTYQVWNRNIKRNPSTENRRHVMQIKWTSLTNDLLQIRNCRQ